MPSPIIIETFDSRAMTILAESPADLIRCKITGTEDPDQARALAEAYIPDELEGLVRQSIRLEHLGAGVWDVEAPYNKRERKEPGYSSYSFSTGGGTQHITQSRRTASKYAASGIAPPDFSGAIGFNGQEIDGVDRVVPALTYSEEHEVPASQVTLSYISTLFHTTACVNSSSFRGFAAGELLFMGASGSKSGKDNWRITYEFSASPNETDLQVGSISGISKRGWDYLWILYGDNVSENHLVKRPIAVYVEEIYRYTSFSALGIGS